MTAPGAGPRVTVAMPLYRSSRFLSTIVENIEVIGVRDVEILISDRHGEDDALEVLRVRYAGDPRVRVLEARDRLSWPEHYNLLLREARGTYVMWMPHDDSFPAGYVETLAACLDAHPAAVLAFGAMDAVDGAGAPMPGWTFRPPPFARGYSSGVGDAMRLLFWGAAIPFRGVFRREVVVARGHFLDADACGADSNWTFGLALTGALRYVPSVRCVKRYYPESTSAGRYRIRDVLRDARDLRAQVRAAPLGRRERLVAGAGLAVWLAVRLVGRVLPAGVRPSRSRVVSRMLPAALRPGQWRGGLGRLRRGLRRPH